MTHSNYTRNILNIEDENIIFEKNCFKKIKIKNIETFVFHGTLTYKPEYCPICGCINESTNDIINWGLKKNCKIKIPKVSNYNTLLILDKQRFYCKHCHSTFTASTSLVNYKKQISNNTRTSVILDLMTKDSEKNISFRNNISTNSTNRILDDISCDNLIKNNGILPTSFGIDEFSATKDTISKLAFIIVDQDSKNIFDINNSRLSNDIYKYFFRYQKSERDKVKYITMDLYKPYYVLMKKLFKNAIKTFSNFEKYIINAFDYELSNGIVEETNNMIKQLKHNACGYRLFSHFKSRIMFIKRLYNPLNNKVKEN